MIIEYKEMMSFSRNNDIGVAFAINWIYSA